MIESKETLRSALKERRRLISVQRRQEAFNTLQSDLLNRLEDKKEILSFANLSEEISLNSLNKQWAQEGRLLLPKVKGKDLQIFRVSDWEEQLSMSPWGILEPIPEHCERIHLSQVAIVLVPGLGFDREKHRIGYGRGYYDRFLKALQHEGTGLAWGIAFQEQRIEYAIPYQAHDVSMDDVLYY